MSAGISFAMIFSNMFILQDKKRGGLAARLGAPTGAEVFDGLVAKCLTAMVPAR